MSEKQPHRAPSSEIAAALEEVDGTRSLPDRLLRLSARFLDRPYAASTLVGGKDSPETLVTRLDKFDCVTYVESVVALARSHRHDAYARRLAELRYLNGRIRWRDRNHYMNRWIARNVRAGLVERVLPDAWVWADGWRSLDGIDGYPCQEWRPRYLPTDAVPALVDAATPGDIVAFVSTKPNLDTFHVGLLVPTTVKKKPGLAIRHASQSAGKVVEQELGAFLASNDVPGMLIARPLAVPSKGAPPSRGRGGR